MNVIDNDPDGSGEFAVGFGDDDGAADLVEAEAKLDRTLQDVWSIVREVQDGPLQRIDHYLCECNGVIQECAACVEGHIDRRFEVASNVIDSLNSRVARSIDRRVDYVNSAVASLLDTIDPAEAGALLGLDVVSPDFDSTGGGGGPTSIAPGGHNPTIDQCRLTPNLPGCYPGGGGGGGGGPEIVIPPTPGGGGFSDPAVIIPPTYGGGGGGFAIGDIVTINCGPMGLDYPAKVIFVGPPTKVQSSIDGKVYTLTGDKSDTAENSWAVSDCTPGGGALPPQGDCIKLCQPVCSPPSGPGDDTTGPGDWTDNATGSTDFPTCGPAATPNGLNDVGLTTDFFGNPLDGSMAAVQVNSPLTLTDAESTMFELSQPTTDGPAPAETGDDGGGQPTQSATCGAVTDVDFTFVATCGPDNWQAAAAAFSQTKSAESFGVADAFSEIKNVLYNNYKASPGDGWLTKGLTWTFVNVVAVMMSLATPLIGLAVRLLPIPKACKTGAFINSFNIASIMGIFNRWVGDVPPGAIRPSYQFMNYSCQTGIPSTTELTAQRLAGVLTAEEWDYGLRLNGDCVSWFQRSYDGGLAVPTIAQTLGLWRAGLIDELQMRKWLKRNRIPDDAPLWEWKKLTEALPGPGELMTFMTRDVVDEDAVNIGDLDQDFARKWTGTIQEWGQRQGVTDEVAKFHWRAHWLPPSTTQLFSMYHRLRPESGYIDANGHPVTFSRDQLYEALKINDLMPAYVDRMIAISHPPLALSYLRMGYVTGVISREELPGRLQDLGYTADDGKTLGESLALSQTNQRAKFLNITDGPTLRKQYLDDSIDDQTFLDGMLAIGSSQEVAVNALESAKSSREAKDRAEITKGLRRAFFAGRIDLGEYRQELLSAGVGAYRVEKIVNRDFTMMKFRYKEISLAKLCKLVGQGYLDMAEYIRRAGNLGYQQSDAAIMAASCVTELQKKRQAELAAAQRQAIADAEKAERKAERERKRQCRIAKESYGCSPAKKPTCPAGVTPPNCDLVS